MLFACIECWGCPPQTRTQRTFREKSFGISKAFAKINGCIRCESSLVYLSFKKGKKGRFGTQFQHILDKTKSTAMPCFLCALSVGAVRPKPGHKGLFEKSPLEAQKLCKNKVMYFGAKFFGLPFSERKVSRWEILLPTFLIRKVG